MTWNLQKKHKFSMQFTFLLIFVAFIGVSTVLLNVFPTTTSRDVVMANKERALLNQGNVLSSSLSGLERLSAEGVSHVMELVVPGDYDRILVTNRAGDILYDTAPNLAGEGESAPLRSARSGESQFYCSYDGDAFRSEVITPVMSYGSLIGSVHIFDNDLEQARTIHSVELRLRSISVLLFILSVLTVLFVTLRLTRRLRELAGAMRTVREGDLSRRVAVKGQDEVAELAETFNKMTDRLESTEELRRRFVSDASHELRTPLAGIRLLSDSIAQSDDMDVALMREFVSDIGMEAERLQRLTEKLLRLTRMDSGVVSERTEVELAPLVERCVHLLQPLAAQKQVQFETELEPGVRICAAEDDLFQIVFNLAENAVKYNREGGTVFLRLCAEDGQAVLAVEDTGIGIPEEDLPHIFVRFYRVDKNRSRAIGGSGLGLSIVHDAVEANGGEIRAERREPEGTRFLLRFPLLEEKREEKEESV
ncbi:MAG: HAMP domain-containing protein [Oscillospiraceae bacterium]|nr:HAMP domain-containing protein [Oscillospiraceae bacterium]